MKRFQLMRNVRVASVSDSDFQQPPCALCGHPISDDRFVRVNPKYCSKKCSAMASSLRRRKQADQINGNYIFRGGLNKAAYRPDKGGHQWK